MATKLPATDIVIIGLGWTGSIIAESMTKAGSNVDAIEQIEHLVFHVGVVRFLHQIRHRA